MLLASYYNLLFLLNIIFMRVLHVSICSSLFLLLHKFNGIHHDLRVHSHTIGSLISQFFCYFKKCCCEDFHAVSSSVHTGSSVPEEGCPGCARGIPGSGSSVYSCQACVGVTLLRILAHTWQSFLLLSVC